MSHRELRKFSEVMKMLGYPRLISLENFRIPNFPLVAELLVWLGKRIDPDFDLSICIDSTTERVQLVTLFARFMAIKAHIKLNMKRLYQADGYSVKEILKVASFLYEAVRQAPSDIEDYKGSHDEQMQLKFDLDINGKVSEMKKARKLGSEITKEGASLYDLLEQEMVLKEMRSNVMSKQLDIPRVESSMHRSINSIRESIETMNNSTESLKSELINMDQKIEKKAVELERSQKRLLALKKVRPAFMDEYEKLDNQLKVSYKEYMSKFCCLTYLEQQLEDLEKFELSKTAEREQGKGKRFDAIKDEASDNFGVLERVPSGVLKEKDANKVEDRRSLRVYGSMTGGYTDHSLDSDTDLDLVDDQEESDLASDEELEMTNMVERKATRGPVESDDDF